ncbi:MAG: DUF349 domain-containing protein [Pseudomonadales bacterium]|nr:DUF349 domain-containing protein [Pseudomonadales bacterium]
MKFGLTPKWQHENPATRITAIETGDLDQEILHQIALEDEAPEVRSCAIAQLTNHEVLLRILKEQASPCLEAAGERLAILEITEPRLGADISFPLLARFAPDTEARLAAVAQLASEEALEALLMADNQSAVWQAAAERITGPERTERLLRHFLNKDKSLVHILKDKQRQWQARQEASASFTERANTIAANLERLAISTEAPDTVRRFRAQIEAWQALIASPPEDTDPAFISPLDDKINQLNLQFEQSVAAAESARMEIETRANEVVLRIEAMVTQLTETAVVDEELSTFLTAAASEWPTGLNQDDELTQRYHTGREKLESLLPQAVRVSGLAALEDQTALEAALAAISWPEEFIKPQVLEEAIARLATLRTADKEVAEKLDRELEIIQGQLTLLSERVEAGTLKPAVKSRNNIARKLDKATPELKSRPGFGAVQDEFNRLTQRLKEMEDWHEFVTNPKRVALCEEMEALITNTDIEPPARATTIKALQEKWKELGASNSTEAQALWSRFKTAGDEAFKPCEVFFTEQKERRNENLRNKNLICEQLENLYAAVNWDQPQDIDWKALADSVSQARKSFRDAGEVPQNRYKKIQGRFIKAIEQLNKPVSEEQDRNKAAKQQLIDQLQTRLDEGSELQELINLAKRAQSDWKKIGITDRKADQKLWKRFRKVCDEVFGQRDSEKQSQVREQDAAKQEARDLCQALRKLIDDDTIERADIRDFKNRFDAIALPREEKQLRRDFDKLCKRANDQFRNRARAAEREAIRELARKAGLCQQLESGAINRETLDAGWQGETELPDEWLAAIEARRDAAAAATDPQARRSDAELLCVQLEILAEIESPAEAQQLRMKFQVERLNRELSQGLKETRSPQDQVRDIQVAWYTLGPVADLAPLQHRFETACHKLGVI